MNRTIRTKEEYDSFCEDVRNRQYIPNPVMVDLSDLWNVETYDWDTEYLEVIRIDNTDVVHIKQYTTENTLYGWLFTFNTYTNTWSAYRGDNACGYWNKENNKSKIHNNKDINTLIEIVKQDGCTTIDLETPHQ